MKTIYPLPIALISLKPIQVDNPIFYSAETQDYYATRIISFLFSLFWEFLSRICQEI